MSGIELRFYKMKEIYEKILKPLNDGHKNFDESTTYEYFDKKEGQSLNNILLIIFESYLLENNQRELFFNGYSCCKSLTNYIIDANIINFESFINDLVEQKEPISTDLIEKIMLFLTDYEVYNIFDHKYRSPLKERRDMCISSGRQIFDINIIYGIYYDGFKLKKYFHTLISKEFIFLINKLINDIFGIHNIETFEFRFMYYNNGINEINELLNDICNTSYELYSTHEHDYIVKLITDKFYSKLDDITVKFLITDDIKKSYYIDINIDTIESFNNFFMDKFNTHINKDYMEIFTNFYNNAKKYIHTFSRKNEKHSYFFHNMKFQ
jgi:hypothetical protein